MRFSILTCCGCVILLSLTHTSPNRIIPPNTPLIWEGSQPISYYVSPGDFGTLPHADVQNEVENALRDWQDVGVLPPLVRGKRQDLITLPDLTLRAPENYERLKRHPVARTIFIAYDPGGVSVAVENDSLPEGKLEALTVNVPADVGGIHKSVVAVGPLATARDAAWFRAILRHELGHAFGLGHTLLHNTKELVSKLALVKPTMFPFSPSSPIHVSDRAWLAYLYRTTGASAAGYGVVSGTLRDSTGKAGISGVNLVAIALNDNQQTSSEGIGDRIRFSIISGYNGQPGAYLIPVLPGRYQLFAQSLPLPTEYDPPFYYADRKSGREFAKIGPWIADSPTSRVVITKNIALQSPEMFDGPSRIEFVPVADGQTRMIDLRLR